VETARIEAQFSYNLGNNQQVAFLLSGNQQNAPAVPSQPAAQAVPAPAAPVTYKVGDTGPAGGLIFYDKGNNTGGWRYLEAAPASAEFTATWDPPGRRFDLRGSNDVALGKGLDNTKAIVTLFSQNGGGFGSAAWDCNDLVVNNFDDWFLPSLTELSYIYGNLHRKGLGGFSSNQYWSSTRHESDDDYAYYINFQDASQGGTYRNNKYYVRAIRQF
ncbi:MAG: DUF1566 domain-containing protein, partial [Treponema sp.]|nr:DUF1566 domain-containing protein [Treponema sp.]